MSISLCKDSIFIPMVDCSYYSWQTGETTYRVTSQSDRQCQYTVDMAVGVCSCHDGVTGGACKHQAAIVKHFKVASGNFLPTSATERALLLKIATGCKRN